MKPIALNLLLELSWPTGEDPRKIAASWDALCHPILEMLSRAPGLKLNMRLGGPLLDLLEESRQESAMLLGMLASSGQIEILGGAHHDAVLSAIPERDALAQLALSRSKIERLSASECRGLCLSRSAWDPSLPRLLARAGFQYAILDGRIVQELGLKAQGWYASEREGSTLAVIPVEPRLSRIVPGISPPQVFALMQQLAGPEGGCLSWHLDLRYLVESPLWFLSLEGTPAEAAFRGLSPDTRGVAWLLGFLGSLAEQDHWLKTGLFSTLLEKQRPESRLYLPSACAGLLYGLPPALPNPRPDAGLRVPRDLCPPQTSPAFLPWESNLGNIGASNRIHKAMLRVSRELDRLRGLLRRAPVEPPGQRGIGFARESSDPRHQALENAEAWLLMAQCATPLALDLWGGVHEGRLRHALWASLIQAQTEIRRALNEQGVTRIDELDLDCDGVQELLVTAQWWDALVGPALGGALLSLSVWSIPGNLLNTMSRKIEPWHRPLLMTRGLPALCDQAMQSKAASAEVEILEEDDESQEVPGHVASSDSFAARPQGPPVAVPPLPAGLVPFQDRGDRFCFRDHFLGPQTTLRNLQMGQFPEQGDFFDGEYDLMRAEADARGWFSIHLARDGIVREGPHRRLVRIVKKYAFDPNNPVFTLNYQVQNRYREPIHLRLGIELNLNLDSTRSPAQLLEVDARGRYSLEQSGERARVAKVGWRDDARMFRLRIETQPQAHLYFYPIETPRLTPRGLQSSFQGTCLFFAWNLDLWGEEKRDIEFRVAMDRELEAATREPRPSPATSTATPGGLNQRRRVRDNS